MSGDSAAYMANMIKHLSVTGLYFVVYEMADAAEYKTIARNNTTDVIYDINMGRIHFQRYRPYMVCGIIDQTRLSGSVVCAITTFDTMIHDAVLQFKKRFEIPSWIHEQTDIGEFVLLCARWTEEQDTRIDQLNNAVQSAAKLFRRQFMKR